MGRLRNREMASRTIFPILIALGIILDGSRVSALNYEFKCPYTFEQNLLETRKLCSEERLWRDRYVEGSWIGRNRIDFTVMCTCEFLSRSIAWKALLTDEVNRLHFAIKTLVDGRTAKDDMLKDFSIDDQSDTMKFWNRFLLFLRGSERDEQITELKKTLLQMFEKSHRNSESHKNPVAPMKLFRNVCYGLRARSKTMIIFLDSLEELTENAQYRYMLMSSDEPMNRVMVVNKVCSFMFP